MLGTADIAYLQNKLETQYAAKRDAYQSEVLDLKQQLEMKGNEVRTLNATVDSLKSVNEELKVSLNDSVDATHLLT
jgi:kinesin family protein 5